MIIAQMTDIHIGFDREARPEELNRQRFRAVLDRLLKQPNTPDMLICSGDITDRGDAESFARTAELLADLPFPVHVMVGNHDSREGRFLERRYNTPGRPIAARDTLCLTKRPGGCIALSCPLAGARAGLTGPRANRTLPRSGRRGSCLAL